MVAAGLNGALASRSLRLACDTGGRRGHGRSVHVPGWTGGGHLCRLTLGLWTMLWTRKETGLPAFRMASTASSWLASLRSTPPTCQEEERQEVRERFS